MRLSVWPDSAQPWASLRSLVRHAEETGWDGVYLADHFMAPDTTGPARAPNECWTTLAALAASTTRIRLGSLVSCVTYRHPAVLANMAATVDGISCGRLVLGVGAGWQENEHRAYGIGFAPFPDRCAQLDEACQVLRSLLRHGRTTFAGAWYSLRDAAVEPRPVQGALPILIGGAGQLTLGLVAKYADEWNMWGRPEDCRMQAERLAVRCLEAGRAPGRIAQSAQAFFVRRQDMAALAAFGSQVPFLPADRPEQIAEAVGAYGAAGVDELVVPMMLIAGLSEQADFLDQILESAQAAIGRAVTTAAGPAGTISSRTKPDCSHSDA